MDADQLISKYTSPQFMPVLISEVTRMSGGNYCVAGWDLHSQRMVRPLQRSGANWRLGNDRSVFTVGHLVNCIPAGLRNTVYPHATEDLILTTSPSFLEAFDEATTFEILLPTCFRSIREIFDSLLVEEKYILDNTNCRSLGGVRTRRSQVRFFEDGYRRLRLQFRDIDNAVYQLPVTCDTLKRIFSPDDDDPEPHFGIDEANEWLQVNTPQTEIVLRIGLARGWDGPDHTWNPRRCYVQLNGIICPTDNYHIFSGPPQ